MGTKYIERLNEQFADLTETIDGTLERAADENRDITPEEKAEVDRLEVQRTTVQASLDHAVAIEERRTKVAERVSKLPAHTPTLTRARDGADPATPADPEKELLREFPDPGHYAATLHRALVRHDKDAIAKIEKAGELLRATAHQTTADNPGLIPRPIVGPVVDRLRNMRPFVQSVGVEAAPAPKFDRPKVTQHVDVDVQAAEKTETASQQMKVDPVAVNLATYAGHLNISKQDIRWSQPSILNLVFSSFGRVYARRTDRAACAAFVTAVTQTQAIETLDPTGIDAALGAAGIVVETADGDMGELNRLWMSRDVAVSLGSMRNQVTGQKVFNLPIVGGTSGDLDGIPVTIDPRFAAGTFIGGDESLVEYWEDLEGFLSVDEPAVLGQLVGYAGYGSLCVVDATGFVQFTLPEPETP